MNTEIKETGASESQKAPKNFRKMVLSASLVVIGALILSMYSFNAINGHETTEDAYVDGSVVLVTSQTSGTVTKINADSTDVVKTGEILVALSSVDADLALNRAEAQLAKTVRLVRGQFSASSQMLANIKVREADYAKALADMQRRQDLVKTGAISAEDFRHTEDSVKVAQASLAIAKEQFEANHALVDRVTVDQHPDVLAAAAQLRDAFVAKKRTQMLAPISGMVTKRNVQVGQRVTPGAAMMSIVALDDLWVTANFKESQINHLRLGQPVEIWADVYGHSVIFHGKVLGVDAGTGSAFSLLPAQNATGNWIKVVQRIPVRIALDPKEVQKNPLRVGLSTKVKVDISNRAGSALPIGNADIRQKHATPVFDDEEAGAAALISEIITANSNGDSRKNTSKL